MPVTDPSASQERLHQDAGERPQSPALRGCHGESDSMCIVAESVVVSQCCGGCQVSTAEVVKSVLLRPASQYCSGCQVSAAEVVKSALLRSANQYC